MNQKGFANIIVIVLVVILAGTAGYFAFHKKSSISKPIVLPAPSLVPATTTSPTSLPGSKNNAILISLGKQFTLRKGQVAKIPNTGFEMEIIEFFNTPCPTGVACVWSGVGILFEYRLNGNVQKGVDLIEAFGFHTNVVKTDHETYANLVVEKTSI